MPRPHAMAASAPLPRWLSETGLYSDSSRLTVDERNRMFTPQYSLWTDGAAKRRWIRLPAGQTIDATDVDRWSFPVGTRLWKEFSFGGRRVETRMLARLSTDEWAFASYIWNADQADAELAPAAGVPDLTEVSPGKRHTIPSVDDCRACHDSNRTEPLGFTALQLSDDRDPLAVHAEEPREGMLTLRTLIGERLLMPVAPELLQMAPVIPSSSPRARAVLGYLSTNCGSCHNAVGSLAPLGLQLRQPAYGGGLEVVAAGLARHTKWDRPGAPPETTKVVDRNTPALSALLLRMKSRRPASQMPPLGSVIADHRALELISGWVTEELAGKTAELTGK
jgi:hypothetical protein